MTTVAPTPAPSPTPAVVFPGKRWRHVERGRFGSVDATLRAGGSTCVAVVKDGRLVHEGYWNGGAAEKAEPVYSVVKSLTSLLVGIFADTGALDLEASASQQITQWRGTSAQRITIRDLLSMSSGRRWSDTTDRQLRLAVGDQTTFATGLPQAREPGELWVYDNAAVQTLEAVLDDVATSDDVGDLARQRLLKPLGMRDTSWGRDAVGNAMTYSGMSSTCRDLARVGHLMLNQGRWRGKQIVSGDYVAQATRPASRLNAAYGLLWWLNARGRIVDVIGQGARPSGGQSYRGRIAPGVPGDAYWAFGSGNQYLAVVPSAGVVAVRLGALSASPPGMTFDSFTSGVLAALG